MRWRVARSQVYASDSEFTFIFESRQSMSQFPASRLPATKLCIDVEKKLVRIDRKKLIENKIQLCVFTFSKLKSSKNSLIRSVFFLVLHNRISAVRHHAHRRRSWICFPREIAGHGRQRDEELHSTLRQSQIHSGRLGHHAINGE